MTQYKGTKYINFIMSIIVTLNDIITKITTIIEN